MVITLLQYIAEMLIDAKLLSPVSFLFLLFLMCQYAVDWCVELFASICAIYCRFWL